MTNLSCITVNAQTRVSGCKNTSDDLYESIYPSLDLRHFIACALEKQFGSFGTLTINEAFFLIALRQRIGHLTLVTFTQLSTSPTWP